MGNKLTAFDANSERAESNFSQVLSPFEEFLPGIRPSNSDAYLTMLAAALRRAGMDVDESCRFITENSPFLLDEARVRRLAHEVFVAELDKMPDLHSAGRVQKETAALNEFMQRRYSLRHNEVLGITEYCERKRFHTSYRPVDETVINSIAIYAREEDIDVWDRDVKRYLKSDRVMRFNPFDAFLASLPNWDKHPRIDKFFHLVPTDDETWYPLAHTWFLGMVALWMGRNRRKGNESMPILVGPQGTGKSTVCRSILPPELDPY